MYNIMRLESIGVEGDMCDRRRLHLRSSACQPRVCEWWCVCHLHSGYFVYVLRFRFFLPHLVCESQELSSSPNET